MQIHVQIHAQHLQIHRICTFFFGCVCILHIFVRFLHSNLEVELAQASEKVRFRFGNNEIWVSNGIAHKFQVRLKVQVFIF